MLFDRLEMIEILEQLGYEVIKERPSDISRKSRYFVKKEYCYIEKDGKELSIEEVFKEELKKRIFNLGRRK